MSDTPSPPNSINNTDSENEPTKINPQHRGIKLNTQGIETEIRRDYLHDYQVIIAPNRGLRPYDTKSTCNQLIETATSPRLDTNPETFRLEGKSGQWLTMVVENKYPSLSMNNPRAYGRQEIVIDTPRANTTFGNLSQRQIEAVLLTFQQRIRELSKLNGIEYVLVFKNEGYESGASLAHAHSQIFALPSVPARFRAESTAAEAYFGENKRDPYDDIIVHEQKAKSRMIFDGKYFAVFCPYAPQWPFEVWFMPKFAQCNFSNFEPSALEELASYLKPIIGKLNRHQISYNFYIENGLSAHQRCQIKLYGRSNVWGGFEVATGIVINSVPPESAAEWYRG